MKKITLLAGCLLFCLSAKSQISFEATKDFAKMHDLTYDATTPNKVYAITFNNHVVVSNDNGVNWQLLFTFPNSNAYLSDFKLLGTTKATFATRDQIHTLNLETNELESSLTIPQSGVAGAGPSYLNSYDIQVVNPDVMIVDTGFSIGFSNFGKTFYTEDGGQTWAEIYYTLNNANVFINNVAVSPTDNKKLFLARGLGDSNVDGGLWISTNGGLDWEEKVAGIAFEPIAFNPDNASEIYAGSSISFGLHPENLYKSTDGGVNWEIVPITWTNETLDNITKIVFHPTNPNRIFVLDENETARTDDGGATWTNVVYPVGIAMDYYYGITASYNPFNESQLMITTDFYPQFSNDGGATLTQIKAPFLNATGSSLGLYDTNLNLYYSAQGGRIHKNLTSGVTTAYETENPDSFNPKRNYMVADPSVPGRVFTYASMGFFGGFLNVSNDYGATTNTIMQAFADDIQELTVDPVNANVIYVSMRSGESSTVHKIDFSDLENVVVTDIITPEMNEFNEGVVTGIIVKSANEMYISKKTKVFKSVDSGTTWEDFSIGLEALNSFSDIIWDMSVNPIDPSQFTVATNIGIFTTTDAAESWTQLVSGADVKRVKHSSINNQVLVGAIHTTEFTQAQIMYSVDGGENWETITPEQLEYVQSGAMDFQFDGTTIHAYLATSDLGVVKYSITDVPLSVKHPTATGTLFVIYPNPAKDQMDLVTTDGSQIKSVSVFSILGQKVMESTQSKIQVSGLASGNYIVKVETTSGKTAIQKLVKQ